MTSGFDDDDNHGRLQAELNRKEAELTERFDTHEPQWILEETHTGIQFWRRKTENRDRIRVKFLHQVQIKEFARTEIETESEWNCQDIVSVALTFLFCLVIGVVLPWYLVVGR